MTENEVQARVMLAIGRAPGVRIFRNTVGEGWHGEVVHRDAGTVTLAHPRRVTFGLCPGSSDLIGWRTLTVTPEMIGLRIAQFIGPEVKTATGRLRDDQRTFVDAVNAAGGLAGVVRSADDARAFIHLPLPAL